MCSRQLLKSANNESRMTSSLEIIAAASCLHSLNKVCSSSSSRSRCDGEARSSDARAILDAVFADGGAAELGRDDVNLCSDDRPCERAGGLQRSGPPREGDGLACSSAILRWALLRYSSN
jgi:hypothetical protein